MGLVTAASAIRQGQRCGANDASAGREPRDISRVLLAQLKTEEMLRCWLIGYAEGYRAVRDMQDRKSS